MFPGRCDFAAGGVLVVGERPLEAALRETAEELGVRGVELAPLREADYLDERTDYRASCFSCTYDGPITWQADEVAWGEWVSPGRLLDLLNELPFVPDTVALLRDIIERWAPEA
ncbi:NUDIX domain-containing protein [Nocardioides sp.]|uniref:NUDIX domain-containing protein n=1 Tax=Nocardioides sp. TaxID=35761 RepID=UPI003512FB93